MIGSDLRRRLRLASSALAAIALLCVAQPAASSPPPPNSYGGLQNALNRLNDRARAYGLANHAPPSTTTGASATNFQILGHNDLGNRDTDGDVWVQGNFAYVGTWEVPCTGRGVKIVDVSDLTAPKMIGALAARPGTSAEDMVVRHVSTPFFTGDLLAVGLQRCGDQPALDGAQFGPDFWDVTDPYYPKHLSFLGVTHGGGGVHELDLFQRGSHVYALLATPFTEWFDPVPGGDFRIVDVTDPRNPVQVGQWGAGAHGLSPGPFYGLGSFGASFDHSVRASADGTKAYVSYWDLGVLTLDISDVTNPTLVGQTHYPLGADGDGHSVSFYHGTSRNFLLQNDEDFDPRSPAFILYGAGSSGIASESPGGSALWLQPGHSLTAPVVVAANQGCAAADYPANTAGKIAIARTPFPFFDPVPGESPLCLQGDHDEPTVLRLPASQCSCPLHRRRDRAGDGRGRLGDTAGATTIMGLPACLRCQQRQSGCEVRRAAERACATGAERLLGDPQQRGRRQPLVCVLVLERRRRARPLTIEPSDTRRPGAGRAVPARRRHLEGSQLHPERHSYRLGSGDPALGQRHLRKRREQRSLDRASNRTGRPVSKQHTPGSGSR